MSKSESKQYEKVKFYLSISELHQAVNTNSCIDWQ